jgi:hypothetical protein
MIGSSSMPARQAPITGGRHAIVGVTSRSKLATKPSTMIRDRAWVVRTPSA